MIRICEQKFFKNFQVLKTCIYLLAFFFSYSVIGQSFSFESATKGNIQTITIFSTSPKQPDKRELIWEKYYENEKVVTVKSWNSGELHEKDSLDYDNAGNLIGKFKIYRNGRMDSTVWTYDTFGNVLTEIHNASYDGNGKTIYSYDQNGKLLVQKFFKKTVDGFILEEEKEIKNNGRTHLQTRYYDGQVSSITLKKFNAKNNLISSTFSIPEQKLKQKTTYKYDKKGRIILSKFIDGRKKMIPERHSYREDWRGNLNLHIEERTNQTYRYFKIENYDSLQNLVGSRTEDQDGLSWEIFNEYDANNHLVKKQKYDRNLEILVIETYNYDQHNNMTENSIYNFEKEKITVQTYHYQYDEFGNWIQLKMYLNNEVFREYRQEIVYFGR